MKVRLNEDAEVVRMVKEGLEARGGYCPCVREISEDTKSMTILASTGKRDIPLIVEIKDVALAN